MIVSLLVIALILCLIYAAYIYRSYFPPLPKRKKHYPYALLLGCPSHDDGSYATSQIKRCDLAIQAYKNGFYDTLIITGGAVKNQYVESEQMAKYILNKETIPLCCEKASRNTWENFQNAKEMIQDQPVLILSSGTHIRRACAIARQFFKDYGASWYPDHKPRHIFREIVSRCIYISIERKKKR